MHFKAIEIKTKNLSYDGTKQIWLYFTNYNDDDNDDEDGDGDKD